MKKKKKIGNEVKLDKEDSSEDEDSVMDDAFNILKGIKIGEIIFLTKII